MADSGDNSSLTILAYEIRQNSDKLNGIHNALFGVEGKGGYLERIEKGERETEKLRELVSIMKDQHDADMKSIQETKNKTIGILTGVSLAAGAVGHKLTALFGGK